MRGGGSRTTEVRKTASSRRRRDRYTQDRVRGPGGHRKGLHEACEDWDDDEADTAC